MFHIKMLHRRKIPSRHRREKNQSVTDEKNTLPFITRSIRAVELNRKIKNIPSLFEKYVCRMQIMKIRKISKLLPVLRYEAGI